jgi:hypothetical protein
MCIPEEIDINSQENNINSCRINLGKRVTNQTRHSARLPESQLLIFKDGGKDLAHITPPPEDYAGFFHGFVYLFAGLMTLHQANIVHFDIKPSNLVGLKKENGSYLLRFIDFGLSKAVADFASGTTDHLYLENYRYWSFELKLLHVSVLKQWHVLNDDDISDFYESLFGNKEEFPYWNWITKDGRYKITPGWAGLMRDDIVSGKITVDFLLSRFDLFALGRAMSEIYCRLTGHYSVGPDDVRFKSYNSPRYAKLNEYNVKLKNEVSIPFYRLIVKMTNPIFIARPSVEDAYEEFKALRPLMRAVLEEYPAALN